MCVLTPLYYYPGRHKGKTKHYLTEEEVVAREERKKREDDWKVSMCCCAPDRDKME